MSNFSYDNYILFLKYIWNFGLAVIYEGYVEGCWIWFWFRIRHETDGGCRGCLIGWTDCDMIVMVKWDDLNEMEWIELER